MPSFKQHLQRKSRRKSRKDVPRPSVTDVIRRLAALHSDDSARRLHVMASMAPRAPQQTVNVHVNVQPAQPQGPLEARSQHLIPSP